MKKPDEKWIVKEARRRKHLLEEIETVNSRINQEKAKLKELRTTLKNLDKKIMEMEEL